MTGSSRQTSLARLQEFGIRPKRHLGQNFLIDDNIVRVILERLEARADDVAIEVGGGLGVLTEALARETAHVHTFEIDPDLEAPLRATVGTNPRVSLYVEDVMRFELESLTPPPTLCASNLPYSVAAPFIAEAVWRLPLIRRYVIMTQREVADRLLARPGSRTYAGVTAWVGMFLELLEHRPLSRKIFYPQPNVDSSLLTFRRREPPELAARHPRVVRRVIEAAFSQRRKALANSLAGGLGVEKAAVIEAIRRVGLDPGVRAETLSSGEFVDLAGAIMQSLQSLHLRDGGEELWTN
ncbi:MAG: 16S rRNA (adenine(1518)-N(6)/adenine(1519)-N(6)) -dimethyltransferase RsmA [Thermoleophilia bacterium]